jgi:hypothetical protein
LVLTPEGVNRLGEMLETLGSNLLDKPRSMPV